MQIGKIHAFIHMINRRMHTHGYLSRGLFHSNHRFIFIHISTHFTRPLIGDENRACKLAGFLSASQIYSITNSKYREVF
jgi:hypothetical protein